MKNQKTTPPMENAIYDAICNTEPLTRLENYRQPGGKRKWIAVGYFVTEPRDLPRTSKEFVEVARFTGEGDAHLYANVLARRPDARTWWAVVVR